MGVINMPCYTPEPSISMGKNLERMLCYACQFLSIEELTNHEGNDVYYNLYYWYRDHLAYDIFDTPKNDIDRLTKYYKEFMRVTQNKGWICRKGETLSLNKNGELCFSIEIDCNNAFGTLRD